MRRLPVLVLTAVALVAAAVPAPASAAAVRTYTYSVIAQGAVYGNVGEVAAVTAEVLRDDRGWSLGGTLAYRQVASGGDLVVILASPSVVDAAAPVCDATYSCRVGNRVYINDVRWRTGTTTWYHGLAEYRRYVLLHEIGHWLGLGHPRCPGTGRSAPVMQQQSISLQGCRANVWPLMEEREAVGRTQGAPVAYSPIEHVYHAMGRAGGVLGGPVHWAQPTADGVGRYQPFQGGAIYWSPSTGAHEAHGLVHRRWQALGYERGPLGYPITSELPTPGGIGRFNHFAGSGGSSIYWTGPTGAQEVYGAIRDRWEALRWEQGPLGFPVTGERGTPNGRGRFNHFQGSGGSSIYWTPQTGAQEVYGGVRDRWEALRWEQGPLGFPVTGERGTPDGRGRFNHFQGSGGSSIYWTWQTGAHEVYGAIRDRWESMGWERSDLGYPTSGEYAVDGGRRNDFENGYIRYDYASMQTEVHLGE